MKYKFKTLYACAAIATASILTSCSDWLEVRPETQQTEEGIFENYKGYRNALTGCYIAMASNTAYGSSLMFTNIDALADVWEVKDETSAYYKLMMHNYDDDDVRGAMQDTYKQLFSIITQANKIIKHAENDASVFPSDATRSVILGEAYAIRAYCQFDLLRLFGDMPNGEGVKVQLPYSDVTEFNERATFYGYADYCQRLEADLNKAEQLLDGNDPICQFTYSQLSNSPELYVDDTFMAYRQSRLNLYAVKALKARAYLYMGKKQEAYEMAKAVIDAKDANGNPVRTLTGVTDRDAKLLLCPNECLFNLSKQGIKASASVLVGASTMAERSSLVISNRRMTSGLFDDAAARDTDKRYLTLWNKDVKVNGLGDYYSALRKYYYVEDDVTDLALNYQIVPMLRLSEMYLIAAETAPSLDEANSYFSTYLLRGCDVIGAPLTEDNREQKVLTEFRREFIGEGQLFYAYKRLGTTRMLWGDRDLTDQDYVLWTSINKYFNP